SARQPKPPVRTSTAMATPTRTLDSMCPAHRIRSTPASSARPLPKGASPVSTNASPGLPRRSDLPHRQKRVDPKPGRLACGQPFQGASKNVGEAASARRKQAKKRSLRVVNEHFEPVFNAAMATQVVFRGALQPGKMRCPAAPALTSCPSPHE